LEMDPEWAWLSLTELSEAQSFLTCCVASQNPSGKDRGLFLITLEDGKEKFYLCDSCALYRSGREAYK
jgi:hypothetical protein